VIRVGHDPALAVGEYLDALAQVLKADRVVARIPSGGL
jgi:hypothetical protein